MRREQPSGALHQPLNEEHEHRRQPRRQEKEIRGRVGGRHPNSSLQKIHHQMTVGLVSVLFMFLLFGTVQADDSQPSSRRRMKNLWDAITQPSLQQDENGRRVKFGELNFTDPTGLLTENGELRVQLMQDEPPITFSGLRKSDHGSFVSWYADSSPTPQALHNSVLDDFSTINLVVSGRSQKLSATIIHNMTVYQIRELPDGRTVVSESENPSHDSDEVYTTGINSPDVDPNVIDKIDTSENNYWNRQRQLRGQERQRRRAQLSDDGDVIDIMVIYTKGAACAAANYGSFGNCVASAENRSAIEGIVQLAIAETNVAFEESDVRTRLRLVKVHYDADYDEYETSWSTTLHRMKVAGDGHMDYVHAMRNQYGADFVSLLADAPRSCGVAYRPAQPNAAEAFSATKWDCATGYYSFIHEVAHNMGCNHDYESTVVKNGVYNHGYVNDKSTDFNQRFRSIMAYDCPSRCKRIQRFSNPNVMFEGQPIGNETANNALWLNNHLKLFASFRPAMVEHAYTAPPTMPPIMNSLGSGGGAARTTPAPTPAPTDLSTAGELKTTLNGGLVGAPGNMFTILAKTDIVVTNFAVHAAAATTITVEVYRRKEFGRAEGYQNDPSAWIHIGTAESFTSSPEHQRTVLPFGAIEPTAVPQGELQAFYVTFTEETNYNRYSQGHHVKKTTAFNNDLQIYEGFAKGYNFGEDFAPRIWNGVVFYHRGKTVPATPLPTLLPTFPPTPMPTSLKPTPTPTVLKTAAPTAPTPSPIRDDPTGAPTPFPTTQAPITAPPTPFPTRAPSRLPTDSSLVVEQLLTSFQGGNGQAGNMIDIVAHQPITVKAFDIHTYSNATVDVLVYTKKGTYKGFDKDENAWELICEAQVMGQGSPNPTHVAAEHVTPVVIEAGQTQAFYITLTERSIRYTNGVVEVDDGIMAITSSAGKKYPFRDTYADRIWNGVVYYTVGEPDRTAFPSPVPIDGSLGPLRTMETTYANRNGSYGSMFNIKAKQFLVVHNLYVHTYHQFGAMVEVEIYKLKHANTGYHGFEQSPNDWELLGSATVEGKGAGKPTQLPPDAIDNFEIEAGQLQALYVTIVGGGLRYSNGDSPPGSPQDPMEFTSNKDLIVYEGSGVGSSHFGDAFFPRVFNGEILYFTPFDHIKRDMPKFTGFNAATFRSAPVDNLKDIGFPCEEDAECKSNICERAIGNTAMDEEMGQVIPEESSSQETAAASPSVREQLANFAQMGGQNRRLFDELRFCMNENSEEEDDVHLQQKRNEDYPPSR